MPNEVLIGTNANCVTENAKFRCEYQVVGGARGNFDFEPTFGISDAELLTDLLTVVKSTILARHGLTILDSEILILGTPTTSTGALGESTGTTAGADGLITGGQVVWTGLLGFTVSAATYRLGGVDYSSPQDDIELGAADADDPRIDIIAVDDNGAVVVIEGTPNPSPSAPSYDPETQIPLTFVLVEEDATTPTGIVNTDIYLDNTEWTTSQVGAHFTLASTSNPFRGTKDVEATSAVANDEVKFVKPAAGTTDLTQYSDLIFYLRFKAAWPGAKSLVVSWLNGSTQIGNAVTVRGGLFNLDAANITTYQQVVIPLSAFNAITPVTSLRMRVTGGSSAIGFYLDSISIQSGVGNVVASPTVESIQFIIDGGGDEITTGVKGDLEIPFACTIQQATLLADTSGAIVIDIWKDIYSAFPPTDADSITALSPPTIAASGVKSQDSTLAGWNKTIGAGSILRFNVDSVTAITRVSLALKVART